MRPLPLSALVILLLAALQAQASEPSPDPDPPIKVRPLKVRFKLPRGGKEAKVFSNEADLAKATSKEIAAELAKEVKFAEESVVLVSYGVGGPPFPQLEYEVKPKPKVVEFYYKKPTGPTGRALKLGLEFFAVTKGTTVKYVGAR